MPYVSDNFQSNPNAPIAKQDAKGNWTNPKWVDAPDPPSAEHGQCVSYVRFVTKGMPKAANWKPGALVKGNYNLAKGTVIATFDKNGHYHGHAAIYVSQSKDGIAVVDQWITGTPKPVSRRLIHWAGKGVSNNGDLFRVVE
jgi:hypothetical protein